MLTQFVAGKTYSTRSICDYDCVIKVTIAKRTAKTVTTTEGKTFRPAIRDGVEQIKPDGSYSMAAIIGADELDGRDERPLCTECHKERIKLGTEWCEKCGEKSAEIYARREAKDREWTKAGHLMFFPV